MRITGFNLAVNRNCLCGYRSGLPAGFSVKEDDDPAQGSAQRTGPGSVCMHLNANKSASGLGRDSEIPETQDR